MNRDSRCSVIFLGGPFDGHQQYLAFSPTELAPVVAVPVNRLILELASSEAPSGEQAMTSVAFYELRESMHLGSSPIYGFIGAVSPGVKDFGDCVAKLRSHQ